MAGFAIDGINSQLDTTALIDSIIQFERQGAVLMERRQAEKTNTVTTLKALQAKIVALETELSKLTRAAAYETSAVSVSDDKYMTVSADGRVSDGSYDVQVLSLARNHQLASQGFDDQSMASLGTGTITLSVGDGSSKVITIDSGNNSLVGIKNAINEADAGVTASIINDGSSSNPYRLILTADDPGYRNQIDIDVNLTGGTSPNFSTGSFDAPELISMSSGSDSSISLGATSSYTGSENKVYTFEVQGTGTQTVGTDVILVNWSDGTNSGTIAVTQADTEVELVGDGGDGLKLSFSAGDLTAGDSFQVAAFSPLLQAASDAKIAFGPAGGGGSPIQVTSESNEFKDVINNVTINVSKETAEGESLTITSTVDYTAVKDKIKSFIEAYNGVLEYIDDQNEYNADTGESGALFGDYTVQRIASQMRGALSQRVSGLEGRYNQLYSVGIRSLPTGRLALTNSGRLDEALKDDLDAVIRLFTNTGESSTSGIEFFSATSETAAGQDFEVNITQAATSGRFQGGELSDPAATPITLTSENNRLKFKVDGVVSDEMVLEARTYNTADELIAELQSKIDNDDKIGSRGLTAEWVETVSGGYVLLTSSGYGSTSKVELQTAIPDSAFATIGLAAGTTYVGRDVEGTINGERAEGNGQYLTGVEGNKTTDGLKIKVTLTSSQLSDGAEGTIAFTQGVASRLNDLVKSINATGEGLIDTKIRGYENQIQDLTEQIEAFDERLAKRRESLLAQFYAMEEALGQLNSENQYLTNQLASINANWGLRGGGGNND